MKLLTFLMRFSPGTAVLVVLAGLVTGACNSGIIAVINMMLGSSGAPSQTLIWSFIALGVVSPLANFGSRLLMTQLTQKVIFELRVRSCRQMLSTPLRKLEEVGGSRLLGALTDDVNSITIAMVAIPHLCMNLAVVLGCLVYLGYLSWMVFAWTIGFIVLEIVSFSLVHRKGLHYLKLARKEQDVLYKHFRGLIDGAKELKLHFRRRAAFIQKAVQPTAQALWRQHAIGQAVFTAGTSLVSLLFFVLISLVLFVLPNVMTVTPQALTGFILTILYLVVHTDVLFSAPATLGRANVALENIESLGLSLAATSNEDDSVVQPDAQPSWKSLEMAGVSHSYYNERENQRFTLGPIQLTLRSGEMCFLIGGNGSGKTTLAKLITGLYLPEAGELRLDGEPVTESNRAAYRQYFSVVFSDFFLFDSLFGLESVEIDAQARDYLGKLQLEKKVEVENGVLSTINLSQGQRKRLALLTAYLEDRPIYLFDEWAADQDPLFKEVFYYHLLPELKARGKTVIVISHDDKYYHLADRIVKLDYGQLVYDKTTSYSVSDATAAPTVFADGLMPIS